MTAIALLCALALTLSVNAQENTTIAQVIYMDSHNAMEYVEVEKEIWKPIHAQRVREGKIVGWYLYRIASPNDGNRNYDYMIVEVYPNWAAMENPYGDIEKTFQEVHGADNMEEMMERTEKSRKMVKAENWTRADWVGRDDMQTTDVKYIVIDWMDVHPGQWGAYMDMERDFYKPVHQKRVDGGNILSWGLSTKMGYSESKGSIDAATTATYASWEAMMNPYPDNAWEDVHGNVSQNAIYERMRKTRTMTGSDILQLIEYVEAEDN